MTEIQKHVQLKNNPQQHHSHKIQNFKGTDAIPSKYHKVTSKATGHYQSLVLLGLQVLLCLQ
jgi:hypothetical protein